VFAAYLITTVVTILAKVWATGADLAQARFVLANMTEVGVPRSWLLPLAASKAPGRPGSCTDCWACGLSGSPPRSGSSCSSPELSPPTSAPASSTTSRSPRAYFALAIASAALAVAAH
jgi:hypothetical protein